MAPASDLAKRKLAAAQACLAGMQDERSVEQGIMEAKGALLLFRDMQDRGGEASALLAYAEGSCLQGSHQSALTASRKARDMCRDLHDQHNELLALSCQCRAHIAAGEAELALSLARGELQTVSANGDRKAEAKLLEILSDMSSLTGDHTAALTCARRCIALYEELTDEAAIERFMPIYARVQRAAGVLDAAVEGVAEVSQRNVGDIQDVIHGKPEEAANRNDCLQALDALAMAVKRRDEKAFYAAMDELVACGGCRPQEVQDTLRRALRGSTDSDDAEPRHSPELPLIAGYCQGKDRGSSSRKSSHFKDRTEAAAVFVVQSGRASQEWEAPRVFNPRVLEGPLRSQDTMH